MVERQEVRGSNSGPGSNFRNLNKFNALRSKGILTEAGVGRIRVILRMG